MENKRESHKLNKFKIQKKKKSEIFHRLYNLIEEKNKQIKTIKESVQTLKNIKFVLDKEALKIFLNKLIDDYEYERFCKKIFREENGLNILFSLLKFYVKEKDYEIIGTILSTIITLSKYKKKNLKIFEKNDGMKYYMILLKNASIENCLDEYDSIPLSRVTYLIHSLLTNDYHGESVNYIKSSLKKNKILLLNFKKNFDEFLWMHYYINNFLLV